MKKPENSFRVWDDFNEKMWYPETLSNDGSDTFIAIYNDKKKTIGWGLYDRKLENRLVSGEFPENVLMNFTGLVAKNGQDKIYPFDIVNVTNKGIYNGLKVVVYDETLLCYVMVWAEEYHNWKGSQHGTTYLKVSSGIKCELVGNIFQNANLLIKNKK